MEYDGDVYHLYGTNTKTDDNYIAGHFVSRANIFEPGAVYTVSTTTPLPSGLYLGVNTQKSDGTAINAGVSNASLYGDGIKKSNTFICRTESNRTLSGFFGIAPTCGTIDVTFKIKLEKGNKATDWTPAPEDKSNVPVLLWENARPTSVFGEQDIGVSNIDNFDFIEVFYRFNINENYNASTKAISGNTISMQYGWGSSQNWERKITVNSNTSLHFEVAVIQTVRIDNSYIIPLKIYGVKEV